MDLQKPNESSSSPFEVQNFVPSLTACNNENEDDRNSQFENSLRENMLAFWKERRAEIHNASDIRSQSPFPLARIKRIMKSNKNVERIGADATILIAKACEFFVKQLTFQAWLHKQENERLTLQHWDIGRAISSNKCTNFLSHIVHAHSQKKVVKNLTEAMFRPTRPLQLPQNINQPEELNLFKETDLPLGNPICSLNMNPAFPLEDQEIPQLFPPSTSFVPSNYHPGFKDEPSQTSS